MQRLYNPTAFKIYKLVVVFKSYGLIYNYKIMEKSNLCCLLQPIIRIMMAKCRWCRLLPAKFRIRMENAVVTCLVSVKKLGYCLNNEMMKACREAGGFTWQKEGAESVENDGKCSVCRFLPVSELPADSVDNDGILQLVQVCTCQKCWQAAWWPQTWESLTGGQGGGDQRRLHLHPHCLHRPRKILKFTNSANIPRWYVCICIMYIYNMCVCVCNHQNEIIIIHTIKRIIIIKH